MRKKENLSFLATRINLEGIMLSEISQRKTDTVWHYLHIKSKTSKVLKTEKRQWLPGTGREELEKCCLRVKLATSR